MNIWLIKVGELLPIGNNNRKMRTTFLASKLVEKGHNVFWWTSAFDHFKKDWAFKKDSQLVVTEGLTIVALKGIGYNKNISFSRYLDHKILARKFRKIAPTMIKPNVIIASSPPYDLAYEAVIFAKKENIPVLVDIRDEWPDLFLDVVSKPFRKLLRIILFRDFHMIKDALLMSDGLIAMMNSLLEWGLKYAERPKGPNDRVFYLGAQKNIGQGLMKNHKFINAFNNKFIITFIGNFVKNNDPSILIKCAERLLNTNIHFVLAGNGELFDKIKKMASGLSNVSLLGWLNQDEIDALLSLSHIGICPTSQFRNAFPNKAFIYLSAGLPILSAFQGDLKDIIKEYQIGFYYPPPDVDALEKCIKRLYDDQNLYKKMSSSVDMVFNELFSADKIYSEYAEHIEKVIIRHKIGI